MFWLFSFVVLLGLFVIAAMLMLIADNTAPAKPPAPNAVEPWEMARAVPLHPETIKTLKQMRRRSSTSV
jgi:hypothetical protein